MLSQDRITPYKDGELVPVPVAAGVVLFAGALVVANATGFAAPGSEATGLTYLGRAEEHVDNSGGADGEQTVLVRRNKAFQFKNAGADPVTQASFGKPCFIVDDETVAATDGTGSRSAAGTVLGVDAGGVWVE